MKIRLMTLVFLLACAGPLLWAKDHINAEKEASLPTEQNVVYREIDKQKLLMDIYLPEGDGPFPAILFVHGGGWVSGDKEQFAPFAEVLSKRGFACFAITYRLKEAGRHPQSAKDCKAAVQWLRTHAEKYKLDTKHIAIAGGSAGGHLAAFVGMTGDDERFRPSDDKNAASDAVQAVIALNGVFDFPALRDHIKGENNMLANFVGKNFEDGENLWAEASPVTHVDTHDPPVLLIHGTEDKTVPFTQSELMQKKLEECGVACKLIAAEGETHGFFNAYRNRDWYEKTVDAIDGFLRKTWNLEQLK